MCFSWKKIKGRETGKKTGGTRELAKGVDDGEFTHGFTFSLDSPLVVFNSFPPHRARLRCMTFNQMFTLIESQEVLAYFTPSCDRVSYCVALNKGGGEGYTNDKKKKTTRTATNQTYPSFRPS